MDAPARGGTVSRDDQKTVVQWVHPSRADTASLGRFIVSPGFPVVGRVPPRLGHDASRRTEQTSAIPSLVDTGPVRAGCSDPERAGPSMLISKPRRQVERPTADDPRRPRDRTFGPATSSNTAEYRLCSTFRRFPAASPIPADRAGKLRTVPKDRYRRLIEKGNFGAGEGIRTLDPNLGKVVLYP